MALIDDVRPAGRPEDLKRTLARRWNPKSFLREPLDFNKPRVFLGWVVLHIILGLISHVGVLFSTTIAALEGIILLAVALRCRRLITLVCALCYAGIGDTWWRMSKAKTPWEMSKILIVVIAIIGLIRFVGHAKNTFFPAAYLFVLLPAAVPVFFSFGFNSARSEVSFVLGGSIALGVGTIFFKQIRCAWPSLQQILCIMIGPVAAAASIASQATSNLDASAFKYAVSNDAVAAGFGANQVSDLLGLGMLFCLFLALQERQWGNRAIALGLGVWFFSQAAVTLSRGGFFSAAIALGVAIPNIMAHRKLGVRFVVGAFVVILLIIIVVFPRLETFTGGAVGKRSQDTSSTLRGKLASRDVEVFKTHLVFGVGVGGSNKYHRVVAGGYALASHTEFSRLIAEHGSLGVLAILCMIAMAGQAYLKQSNSFGRAWTLSMVTWSAVTMSHSATRIGAIALTFALASLAVDDHDLPPTWGERRLARRGTRSLSRSMSQRLTADDIATRRAQFQARRDAAANGNSSPLI